MSDLSGQSRRDFFNLSAAAGASLLAVGATPDSASAATAPEETAIPSGTEWAVRGKVLQAPAPDQLEALADASSSAPMA